MHEMQLYGNEQFGEIRTMVRDGEPWFVAADVCRILELNDTGRATERLDSDELTRIKIESGGQNREMIIINEAGLYTLVLGSRKPEARAFKRWVTHEVLPSIRRYGAYISSAALNDPDIVELLSETVRRMKADNDKLRRKLARTGAGAAALPEKGCRAFVDSLREMIRSGEARLISPYAQDAISPDRDVIGYIDSRYLYLIPRAVLDRIDAERERYGELFPTEARALYKMLRQNGYIKPDGGGRSTRGKGIGAKIVRLLWVPRSKAGGFGRDEWE